MITHLYVADRTVKPDHRGRYPCLRCPLPRENKAHVVADRTDEEKSEEARRMGESE